MSDSADIRRLVGDMFHLGTTESVDLASVTRTVTAWRPRLVQDVVAGLPCRPPARGHRLPRWASNACGFAPEEDIAAGVVLLGLYSDANPASDSGAGRALVEYAVGARIVYDATTYKPLHTCIRAPGLGGGAGFGYMRGAEGTRQGTEFSSV